MRRKIRIQLWLYYMKFGKRIAALGVLFVLAFLINFFIFSTFEAQHPGDYLVNKGFGVIIPKDLEFCGEKVPVYDLSVREALEREFLINTYWQSQTFLIHKRARRWFPVIEPILEKHGVPDDFKYLAIVESNLTNTISRRDAVGFWQIIEGTARVYGLEINEEIDERYHVEKATHAACRYFKEAYKRFGNWTLTAASYNLGMGGIESRLQRQKVKTLYELELNEETARYVYKTLAIKEIISHPKTYGYHIRRKDYYPAIPVYTVKVDSSISDLASFALKHGVNYKILKYFNPWLLHNRLSNPARKVYQMIFPKNKNLSMLFEEEDKESTEAASPAKQDSVTLTDTAFVRHIHLVNDSETVSILAEKYRLEESYIRMWNKIEKDEDLKPRQEIILYLNREKKD